MRGARKSRTGRGPLKIPVVTQVPTAPAAPATPAECAFVASCGGLKAYAFHTGVLRALAENGFRRRLAWMPRVPAQPRTDGSIEITTYIGSSAGACIAAACAFFASLDDTEGV